MSNEFSTQSILELACAAYRINGAYRKETIDIYDNNSYEYLYTAFSNKILMLSAIGVDVNKADAKCRIPLINVKGEDRDFANSIKKYYRKLVFSVLSKDDTFWTAVNQMLTTDTVRTDSFGFIACLPHLYLKEIRENEIAGFYNSAEDKHLGAIGSWIVDKDCEVIEAKVSSGYPELLNVYGIVDNCLVWWMSKTVVTPGPCVIVKSKIKDHINHWKYGKAVTRLNYIKAAQ